MKKTLFLLAALCCAVTSWAECTNFTVKSTTELTPYFKNISVENGVTLTFEDAFESTMTFHERYYAIRMFYKTTDTHFYEGSGTSYYYGYLDSDCKIHTTDVGFVVDREYTSKGGKVSVDIRDMIESCLALGYNECVIGISGSYKMSSESSGYTGYYAYGIDQNKIYHTNSISHTIATANINFYEGEKLLGSWENALCGLFPYSGLGLTIPTPTQSSKGWKLDNKGEILSNDDIYLQRIDGNKNYYSVGPESYQLFINGIQATDDNLTDILGDGGSIEYNPTSQTLQINNDVAISSSSASAIVFSGSGSSNTDFTIELNAEEILLQSAGKGINVSNANLVIMNSNKDAILTILSDQEAMTIDGNLSLRKTTVYAFSNQSISLSLFDHSLTVDSTFLLMRPGTGISTCTGISELKLINSAFLTEGISFSKESKTFIDDAIGAIATKQITIKPQEEHETSIFCIHEDSNANVSKRIVNGQLLIQREGRIYNAQGAQVK